MLYFNLAHKYDLKEKKNVNIQPYLTISVPSR